jgi:hypothetical protein
MTIHMTETEWWHDLCHGILGPRKGGARIIIDAEDAKTGVGKTGLAVFLARLLAEQVFDYQVTEDDLTLSGAKYIERWRGHPGEEQPSSIVLDELGGAGAGHARRAMSNQNVELGNSWQLMRKKRIISIVTLPHWSKVDRDMRKQADFRLWCLKEPIGYFQPYEVGVEFDSGEVMTDGYDDVDRINFPNMDKHDDPVYKYLAGEKDELLESEFFDADKLVDGSEPEETMSPDKARREERVEIAQRKRNNGDTAREIADDVGMSHTWVIENTEAPGGEA